MKFIFVVIALLALAACQPAQVKHDVEVQILHDTAVKLEPVADPDLDNQIALATAAGDTEGVACAVATKNLIHNLATQTPPPLVGADCPPGQFFEATSHACRIGVATTIEQLRLAANRPPPAPLRLPPEWIKGCAVVAHDLRLSAVQLLAKFGVDAGKFGLGAAAVLP
jgi:hypothetical protein